MSKIEMLKDFSPIVIEEKEKTAQYVDYEIDLEIKNVLEGRGIKKFYKYQKEAIEKILANKNVIIMAPTAAGKTECYLIPSINAARKGKRSLLIYPTKALATDQLKRFKEFSIFGIKTEIYDGDTPAHIREKIRNEPPHCLITNFDMLHFILLNNRLWKKFFSSLKYVIIDEAHSYCGIFGCHVANIIERLERITKEYGQELNYILSSATIGNPLEFCRELVGKNDFQVIEAEGCPRGKIIHYIINQPDESIVSTAIKVAKEINKKTIIFGNSHNLVERISYLANKLDFSIQVYRAGLTPEKRREIEKDFAEGRINCIAATSALELGIDIKDADVAILAGFPGSVTKTKQRIGRVGRKNQTSYAIFIAKQSPLDQYYATNPSQYLEGSPENCYASKYNESIRKLQLIAAAKDKPIKSEELQGEDLELIKKATEERYLKEFKGLYFTTKKGTILARTISLRGTNKKIDIIDQQTKKKIGERETSLAIGELYEGAIYLLGGKRYLVQTIDLEKNFAYVREIEEEEDWNIYTQAYKQKELEIIQTLSQQKIDDLLIEYGKIYVQNTVDRYAIKNIYTNQTLAINNLKTPLTYNYYTYGFWLDLANYLELKREELEGLHAFEHITISMMGAISGVDQSEIGGISYPTGRIIYYEGIEGGTGACFPIIRNYKKCVEMALDRLKKCDCIEGCPKCIFSPQCGNDNKYLNKEMAIEIAKKILKIK
ncbi:MAG: DEAD/DEAH box helicase [Candidatus Micrarchaeota archaeon]|nr:DEAD/DEAH box helicase [Candidatus Micrarchaeota archaeon]